MTKWLSWRTKNRKAGGHWRTAKQSKLVTLQNGTLARSRDLRFSDLEVWGTGHIAEWVLMSSGDVYSSFVTIADLIRDVSGIPDL